MRVGPLGFSTSMRVVTSKVRQAGAFDACASRRPGVKTTGARPAARRKSRRWIDRAREIMVAQFYQSTRGRTVNDCDSARRLVQVAAAVAEDHLASDQLSIIAGDKCGERGEMLGSHAL